MADFPERANQKYEKGVTFSKCIVFHSNDFAWFLKHEKCIPDIVMLKEELDPVFEIKKGDMIDVTVDHIEIADDGTPGLFVRPSTNPNISRGGGSRQVWNEASRQLVLEKQSQAKQSQAKQSHSSDLE